MFSLSFDKNLNKRRKCSTIQGWFYVSRTTGVPLFLLKDSTYLFTAIIFISVTIT